MITDKKIEIAQDNTRLEKSWQSKIGGELTRPYMDTLKKFIAHEKTAGKIIYPKDNEYFRALDLTPLSGVRVVILGQDPYHGEGQAHGLCFSVKPDVKTPPSLKNIYKELQSDLRINPASHGFLESWAQQGVLLLNSVLTVEQAQAGSHQGQGWEKFTDAVIRAVDEQETPVVFLLWGSSAQKKADFVDTSRHLVLKAPHPSPLSAHRGFLGCKHFSQTNEFLKSKDLKPINWKLPETTNEAA